MGFALRTKDRGKLLEGCFDSQSGLEKFILRFNKNVETFFVSKMFKF